MDRPTDFDAMSLFALCMQEMRMRGLSVDQTTNFDEAEKRSWEMGKSSVTPMLSTEFNDFSLDDAFWLFLRKNGQDVGCVAARRDNLFSETLADYWARTYKRYYGLSGDKLTHSHAPSALHDIRGNVVYMGEFFVRKDHRGSRNQLSLFTHLLFAYCTMKWRPDWLYAFIRKDDIRKGYGGEYGFVRQVPGAQIWPAPPPGRQSDEYLVAVSRSDLMHLSRVYCLNPEQLLSADSLTRVEKLRI